ncbi:Ubiquitin_carboxyl-terminal hydrolase family protein [Hexamita inflata]|uniref:Ubiquitin_carboxyl-terminal hydrolase family protein n=1 Tax=Hexamita inflata TaxID=28002 RepID=A0ABP1H5E1_9EUKA
MQNEDQSFSEFKFKYQKPFEQMEFNTSTKMCNPSSQNNIPNYEPPKFGGEEPPNGLSSQHNIRYNDICQILMNKNLEMDTFLMESNKIFEKNKTIVSQLIQEQQQQFQQFNLELKQLRTCIIKLTYNKILSEHRGLDPLLTKNTSMLNALLQSIYNTEAGCNAILRGPNESEVIERIEKASELEPIDKDDQSVVSALQLIFLRMQYSQKPSISTLKFCKAMGIDTGKQEDANELMKNLLGKLEKASKAHDAKNNFEYTLEVYKETFEGQTGSTVRCLQCQNESQTQKPLTDLMMPVEEDFFKCFAAMVEQHEDLECKKCKGRQVQYFNVQSAPDLLCMTLQRLQRNEQGKEVKFPIFLDLEFIQNCNALELGKDKSVAERQS